MWHRRPAAAHDRHVRFRLPERVLNSPARENAPGSWLSHGSPDTSVMMQVPPIGAFVRALMPVSLSGGYTVTYGLWVGIAPAGSSEGVRGLVGGGVQGFASGWIPGELGPALEAAGSACQSCRTRSGAHPVLLGELGPAAFPGATEQWPHDEIIDSLP